MTSIPNIKCLPDGTYCPPARSTQEASAQSRVWARAQTLFDCEDPNHVQDTGYVCVPIEGTTTEFWIYKPRFTDEKPYHVIVSETEQSCSCPFFAGVPAHVQGEHHIPEQKGRSFCKHLWAFQFYVAENGKLPPQRQWQAEDEEADAA